MSVAQFCNRLSANPFYNMCRHYGLTDRNGVSKERHKRFCDQRKTSRSHSSATVCKSDVVIEISRGHSVCHNCVDLSSRPRQQALVPECVGPCVRFRSQHTNRSLFCTLRDIVDLQRGQWLPVSYALQGFEDMRFLGCALGLTQVNVGEFCLLRGFTCSGPEENVEV